MKTDKTENVKCDKVISRYFMTIAFHENTLGESYKNKYSCSSIFSRLYHNPFIFFIFTKKPNKHTLTGKQ